MGTQVQRRALNYKRIHLSDKVYNWSQVALMWSPINYIRSCLDTHKLFPSKNQLATSWISHYSPKFSKIFDHGPKNEEVDQNNDK